MRSRHTALILLGLAGMSVYNSLFWNTGEIARVRADAERLAREHDSLQAAVRERDERQVALAFERDAFHADANRWRDSVRAVERRRAERQVTLRQVRTVGVLQDTLRAVFPELGETGWGLATVPLDAGDTLGLEVLLVPAWFAETLAIDRVNAESWRAQKDRLLAVDSLQLRVAQLQDSITQLERASRLAYASGYQAAYAAHQDLSGRYVAELRKPRVTLGRTVGLLAAVGAGVVLGVVVR
jgi:uncharacterized small protein (DUF1192 family)